MVKVLWICGLPDEVRRRGVGEGVSPIATPAWSWILGHLPPPRDVDLHILCPAVGLKSAECHFDYQGAHWHCFRQKRFEQVFFWQRIVRTVRPFVRKLRPDVIHGWGGETGHGWIATCLSDRAVVSVQGLARLYDDQMRTFGLAQKWSMEWEVRKAMEWRAYARAVRCLAESAFSANALQGYYGRKAEVVAHPLRAPFLSEVRQAVRTGGEILFVGSLCPRKGVLDALSAFARISDSAARLTLVGDGELACRVEALIGNCRLKSRVTWLRNCSADELAQRMQSARVFLLPSYGDTGPTALKEALAQGCVPVCYDNSGPREFVTRYGGFLVPTGDVAALATSLASALGSPAQAVRDADVRRDLSRETVWRQLQAQYQEVA